MNYMMTFSDGSVWAIPVSTIAIHHAGIFAENYDGDLVESLNKGTIPKFKDDFEAIRNWAITSMNWADVSDEAVKISESTKINFYKEWIACSVQIK